MILPGTENELSETIDQFKSARTTVAPRTTTLSRKFRTPTLCGHDNFCQFSGELYLINCPKVFVFPPSTSMPLLLYLPRRDHTMEAC